MRGFSIIGLTILNSKSDHMKNMIAIMGAIMYGKGWLYMGAGLSGLNPTNSKSTEVSKEIKVQILRALKLDWCLHHVSDNFTLVASSAVCFFN
jgi:hypothetical protein